MNADKDHQRSSALISGRLAFVQMANIELQDLEVRLGGRVVLDGLTGSLQGRAIGLLGPNGSGKSTLINTLLGFHPASRGTASVFGHDIRHHSNQIRAIAGYMPEN